MGQFKLINFDLRGLCNTREHCNFFCNQFVEFFGCAGGSFDAHGGQALSHLRLTQDDGNIRIELVYDGFGCSAGCQQATND